MACHNNLRIDNATYPYYTIYQNLCIRLTRALSLNCVLRRLSMSCHLLLIPNRHSNVKGLTVIYYPVNVLVVVNRIINLVITFYAYITRLVHTCYDLEDGIYTRTLTSRLTHLYGNYCQYQERCADLVKQCIGSGYDITACNFRVRLRRTLKDIQALTVIVRPSTINNFDVALTERPRPSILYSMRTVAFKQMVAVLNTPIDLSNPSDLVTGPANLSTGAPGRTIKTRLVRNVARIKRVVMYDSISATYAAFSAVVATTTINAVGPRFGLINTVLNGFNALTRRSLFSMTINTVRHAITIPQESVRTVFRVRITNDLNGITQGVSNATVLIAEINSVIINHLNEPRTRAVIILRRNGTAARADDFNHLRPLTQVKYYHKDGNLTILISVAPFRANMDIRTVIGRNVVLHFLPFRLTEVKRQVRKRQFIIEVKWLLFCRQREYLHVETRKGYDGTRARTRT